MNTVPRLVVVPILLGAALAAAQGVSPLNPGPHDMLQPVGPQADHIGQLWNLFLFMCTAVTLAIFAAFLFALARARRAGEREPPDLSSLDRHERGPFRSVVTAVVVSAALLVVLLVASVWTDRALARMSLVNAVNLTVTGHQWWWDIRYEGNPDSDTFTTANELHVPVGRPVVITLRSNDVIHSLWVPNIAGKKDLIPGRTALLQFRADKPGLYRGQCAEFCGLQHAYMGLEIIADPPDRYEAWAAQQRKEPPPPKDAVLQRGQQVFVGSTCVMCHQIQGTPAQARSGPDLTHVGGRTTLAAGALNNDRDEMKRWITDPQKIKPGTNMPATTLSDTDMNALVAYLESLK
ncbi:MAG: cytochrome c oxidase subunit II [Rhizobacter sp.]